MVSPSSSAKKQASLSMWAVLKSIIEWCWTVIVRICPLASMSLLEHANWSLCNASTSQTIMILHFHDLGSTAGYFSVHWCCCLLLCIDQIMLLLSVPFPPFWWWSCICTSINMGFNSITQGGAVTNFKVSQHILTMLISLQIVASSRWGSVASNNTLQTWWNH